MWGTHHIRNGVVGVQDPKTVPGSGWVEGRTIVHPVPRYSDPLILSLALVVRTCLSQYENYGCLTCAGGNIHILVLRPTHSLIMNAKERTTDGATIILVRGRIGSKSERVAFFLLELAIRASSSTQVFVRSFIIPCTKCDISRYRTTKVSF
jgi:hypothetical protein